MDWTTPLIIGPLCMGAGVFIGMLLMRMLDRNSGDAEALATLREEFDEYRTTVGEHFEQTSELFQGMTEKYRDVYNHLAAGAQQFGSSEESPPRLEIVQPAAQLSAAAAKESTAPESNEDARSSDADSGSDESVAEQSAAEKTAAIGTAEADAGQTAADGDNADADAAPDAAEDTDGVTAAATDKAEGDDAAKDAFDPSSLDESELADLEDAKSDAQADDQSESAEPEKARVAQNTFRNMPQSDEHAPAASAVNGTGKTDADTRKEPATQA